MRKLILFFFIYACAFTAQAQQITIKDNVTRQPLEFVTIYSQETNASAMTNVKGNADIGSFKDADNIIIRLVGYQQREMSFDEIRANNFLVLLDPSQVYLDEVVVSATRWEQEKRAVPNKIASIPAAEITMQNPQTAADLLGFSGGIFIQKSQLGGGSPMIRGFAANRVLITVDGVRMNNAIFRSGNLQNVISIDPFSVSKTEVIYGPGSVIYGSDAIGGVMNFYTLKPVFSVEDKPFVRGSATVRYATASNEKTGHFNVNIGLKKWAFLSSVSYNDFGDLKMGSHGPDDYLRHEYVERINGIDSIIPNDDPKVQIPTGYNQLNLMQKIRFMPNDYWDFNYGFYYSTTSDYPRYDRLIRYRDSLPRSAEWYYGPQKWMMNSLNIVGLKKTRVYDKLGITLAHQFFEESRHDRDFRDVTLVNRTEQVDVLSANLDFEKQLPKDQSLFYGLEVLLNQVGSEANNENITTGEKTAAATRYPDGASWNSYAAYLSYSNSLNEQLRFQGGLRYNLVTAETTFDTTFYPFPFTNADLNTGALTGSAGLTYETVDNMLFYLNLSTGFRAPNIDDLGKVFDSEPGSVVVPNPDLKPEYAYNGEFGIRKRFNGFLEVDVSVFYTLLDDALVRRDYQLDGKDSIMYDGQLSRVQAIQNASQAWVYGIQADIEADLPAGFGLNAHFNFQHGEEELEDGSTAPLRHAAPTYGMFHITYARSKFKADFYGIFNGEIPYDDLAPSEKGKPYLYAKNANGDPYSPSWYTLNLKLMYQLTDYLMINAGIENITDQRYRPYSSGIAGPGRNFIASLKLNF